MSVCRTAFDFSFVVASVLARALLKQVKIRHSFSVYYVTQIPVDQSFSFRTLFPELFRGSAQFIDNLTIPPFLLGTKNSVGLPSF